MAEQIKELTRKIPALFFEMLNQTLETKQCIRLKNKGRLKLLVKLHCFSNKNAPNTNVPAMT